MASAIDWTPVEEAAGEDTLPAYKVALLESLKILEQRLAEERIPGGKLHEKLASAKLHFTRPQDIERAAGYTDKLRHGQTGALTKDRAQNYLQAYRQAVADLNDLSQSRDSWQAKMKLYLGLIRGKQRLALRALAGVGIFFVAVLVLADTPPGKLLVDLVVGIVHLFFAWILGLLIIAALLLATILGTAMYLDHNRGGRIKDGE